MLIVNSEQARGWGLPEILSCDLFFARNIELSFVSALEILSSVTGSCADLCLSPGGNTDLCPEVQICLSARKLGVDTYLNLLPYTRFVLIGFILILIP